MKKLAVSKLRRYGLLLCLAGFPVAYGQQYSISTVAGGSPPPTPAAALSTTIGSPRRVAVDSGGNVYFSSGNAVYKITGTNLAVVAGNGRAGFSGDGGLGVNAQLNSPAGLAVDSAGNVYIADSLNNRIRVVSAAGVIKTFAGNGLLGSVGNFGDGGQAANANLYLPQGVAVDSKGNVYIADTADNLIRKVSTNGVISTLAGDSLASYTGDGKIGSSAEVNHPSDVAVDSAGNVFVADTSNSLIRKIGTDGVINLYAGSISTVGFSGDGASATLAGLSEPYSIALDSAGNLYIAERADGRVRQVDAKTGNINTTVGNGTLGFAGDGSAASKANLNLPTGIAIDSGGNVYIADSGNNRIRKVAGTSGTSTITSIAGNGGIAYSGDGGQATKSQLNAPQAVAVDANGNFYIADTGNNVVRKVTAAGAISTLAGNGTAGFGGDGNAAASAQLNAPQGVAVDAAGNVYIADTGNARVRRVTAGGTISTYAGNGTAGFGGDGSTATGAQLNLPIGLTVDSGNNLYIADYGNNLVRKVTSGGTISTIAGNGIQGFTGDGGKATSAALNGPQAVAADNAGNLFIADSQNSRIRVVLPTGTIATVAGNGTAGYTGDGKLATAAQIVTPAGLTVDPQGNLYITDSASVVRKIFLNGPIVTIAGTGTAGYSGDGGVASKATLNVPTGLAADAKGNLYVADTANGAVRLLQATGAGSTVGAVVSAASNTVGAVTPGEAVVLYGTGLGAAGVSQATLTASGLLSTSVAGTSVYFNGVAGPILYTSPNQVSAIVPFGVSGPNVQVYVTYNGQATIPVSVAVTPSAPSFFTQDFSGKGQASAVNNDDGSFNGAAHPVKAGSYITLYATGLGQTNPPGVDGMPAAVPLPQAALPVSATIGGKSAVVQYSGGAPGIVAGVFQINLLVPSGLTPGPNAVVLTVGGVQSPAGVTIVTQ